MKQFVYKPEHADLAEWPAGILRLDDIEQTEDPDAADVFVIPGFLTKLFPNRQSLYKLSHFRVKESRHVAFDCSDNEPLYDTSAMFIRCNTRSWYLERDPNTISWPWPVEDYLDCVKLPAEGFKYDVSFHGWIRSHDTRQHAFDTMRGSQLQCDLAGYTDFTGYIWDTPEGLRRRREFRRSLHESRLVLCPESISGVFPYRFWEAMSAGRIPVLIGSDFVFPMSDVINYSAFMIHIERRDRDSVNAVLTKFLREHDDATIETMGKIARAQWEAWLDARHWTQLHSLAVRKKLEIRQFD